MIIDAIIDAIIATGTFLVVMSVIFFVLLPCCVLSMIPVIGDPFACFVEWVGHRIWGK